MAVSIVTSGGGAISNGSPSVTFAGYVPALNDMILMFPSSQSTLALNASPSDWVNPLGSGVEVNGDAHGASVGYHWVTSGEVSGGTTTYTMTSWFGTETGYVHGVVLRGVDTSTPIDSINTTFDDGNAATPHLTATLTGANVGTGSLVVASVARDSTGAYGSTPAGWTDIQKTNTNQAKWTASRDALTSAGVDVTAASISPSAGDEYISITVALTPAADPSLLVNTSDSITVTESVQRRTENRIAVSDSATVSESKSLVIPSPPTVTLDTVDEEEFADDTPTLEFTGTDADGDDVTYEAQIGTDASFSAGGIADEYPSSNFNDSYTLQSGSRIAVGQSFTGVGGVLDTAYMRLNGSVFSASGNVTLQIYAHSGTFGTNSVATGSALATSDPINANTMSVTSNYVFTFTGANKVSLNSGTEYVLVLNYSGANILIAQLDTSSPTHAGNASNYVSSWTGDSGRDLIFGVSVDASLLIEASSATDPGFANEDDGGDSDPFTSGDQMSYTVQGGDALADGTYFWRVRGKDPSGTNTWGAWSETREFTVDTSAGGDLAINTSDSATVSENRSVIPSIMLAQSEAAFYEDGTETGSSIIDSGADSITRDVSGGDSNLQLRVRLQNNGAAGDSTDDYQLQYELNDSGTYVSVGGIVIDSYSESNYSVDTGALSPTLSFGQSITGDGATLTGAKFYVKKGGSPTGNLVAKIYAHSGTFGSSSVGTGSALATSDNFDVATLTTSLSVISLSFSGVNQISLGSGTRYVVTLDAAGVTFSGGSVVMGGDNSSPSHAGNASVCSGGFWFDDSSLDLCFYLTTSNRVLGYNSSNLTDGNATTNRLGSGSGSFVAGKISEDGLVDNLQITASNYTELLYSLTLESTALADTDTLDFRVLRNGATSTVNYAVTPRITIDSGGGDLSVNTSDSITVTESVQRMAENRISVSDTATITEAVQRDTTNRIAVSDTANITENRNILIPELLVSKSDTITVSESVQRLAENRIATSDSTTVSEALQRLVEGRVAVSDSLTVTEAVQRHTENRIAVSDTITATEAISLLIPELFLNVSDNATVTESVTASVSASGSYVVNVSDSVTLTESTTLDELVTVSRADSVTVSESTSIDVNQATPREVTVSDSVTITESLQNTGSTSLSTTDSVTITEGVDKLVENRVATTDTTTITESVGVSIQATATPTISVSDEVTVAEFRVVSVEGVVNPRKYYIDTKGNIYWLLNESIGLVEPI